MTAKKCTEKGAAPAKLLFCLFNLIIIIIIIIIITIIIIIIITILIIIIETLFASQIPWFGFGC